VKVLLPGALLRFADYTKEVDVKARTLSEGIEELMAQFPGLRPVLLDGDGRVRLTHQLFLNGEQVVRGDYPVGVAPLPVTEEDTLFVLTAVAGG